MQCVGVAIVSSIVRETNKGRYSYLRSGLARGCSCDD
jgi:hypothetical protein